GAAVHYNGNGPLTLVGCKFTGRGIVDAAPADVPFHGALSVIDSIFSEVGHKPAIRPNHGVVLDNVFVKGTETAVEILGACALKAADEAWTEIEKWAGGPGSVMMAGRETGVADVIIKARVPDNARL